jgi:nucleoid-associated protein YgaU
MSPEQKKNILDQAIDALTNRDEKAAAAAAAAKAQADANAKAAAEANAKNVAAANAKAAADNAAKAAADAKAKAEEEVRAAAYAKAQAEAKAFADAKAAADAILTTHKVVAGETLSDIAMKYYKSSVREKWIKIYEANKAIIGDNPGMIKAGQELKIPKL